MLQFTPVYSGKFGNIKKLLVWLVGRGKAMGGRGVGGWGIYCIAAGGGR